jgi:hypothetical protein
VVEFLGEKYLRATRIPTLCRLSLSLSPFKSFLRFSENIPIAMGGYFCDGDILSAKRKVVKISPSRWDGDILSAKRPHRENIPIRHGDILAA